MWLIVGTAILLVVVDHQLLSVLHIILDYQKQHAVLKIANNAQHQTKCMNKKSVSKRN